MSRQSTHFVIAFVTLFVGFFVAGAARAQDATIEMEIVKVGFIVGGGGGEGVLNFEGESHPFDIGGISFGATIGASKTELRGEVYNLEKLEDFPGTYTAKGQSAVLGGGETEVELENDRGVELSVSGKAMGLELSLDLSGLEISFR